MPGSSSNKLTIAGWRAKAGAAAVGMAVLLLSAASAARLVGSSLSRGPAVIEFADLAGYLAPSDPQAYFTKAVFLEQSMLPEDLPLALEMYEKAAGLAPNDYRYWLSLGKAKERNGNSEAAEAALRKAADLAPEYADVLWTLGNTQVRRGAQDEGFESIRKAVSKDAKYASPAAALAWDVFEGELSRVEQVLGESPQVKAALAEILTSRERYDDAVRFWNAVPDHAVATQFAEKGRTIANALFAAKRYRDSVIVGHRVAEGSAVPKVGAVTNGGFESDVSMTGSGPFDWKIEPGAVPKIGLSVDEKRAGERSLVVVYDPGSAREFRALSQLAAVEPGSKYRFTIGYRSELNAEFTFRWVVLDAVTGEELGNSEPIAAKSGWSASSVEFTAPEGSDGVVIRFARRECLDTECSIDGKVWFDEAVLEAVE